MITLNSFNRLPLPKAVVRRAAEQAAFEAVQEFHLARRALSTPFARGREQQIHANVLQADRLAESLVRAA